MPPTIGDVTPWVALSAPVPPGGNARLRARFIERPHRFAARVELADGSIVEAHLANPGRLTGVLAPGCDVLLDGPFPPPRVLPYTMLAARVGRVWAGTVTTYANHVFPSLLRAGIFPELGGGDEGAIRREVAHGRSRFDFETGGWLVEVKSVSLSDGGAGLFPDAVTARGTRHSEDLAHLARRGRSTAIVFVAQREDIASVSPADAIDPAFGRALRAASRAGVVVLACALRMRVRGATAARRVPVRL